MTNTNIHTTINSVRPSFNKANVVMDSCVKSYWHKVKIKS